jgi:DHA1 family inner membrane transport protein
MTDVTGYADGSVTWLLVLFGLGMVAGNLIGGRFADRRLMPMLYTALGALAAVLALFTVTAHDKAAAADSGAEGSAATRTVRVRVRVRVRVPAGRG